MAVNSVGRTIFGRIEILGSFLKKMCHFRSFLVYKFIKNMRTLMVFYNIIECRICVYLKTGTFYFTFTQKLAYLSSGHIVIHSNLIFGMLSYSYRVSL